MFCYCYWTYLKCQRDSHKTSKEQIKGGKKDMQGTFRGQKQKILEVKKIQEITVTTKCPESNASRIWENYLSSGGF